MMRVAAHQSGLTASIDSKNLILCLEPEGVCFSALAQSLMSSPYLSKNTLPDEEEDVDFCDVDYEEIRRQEERGSDDQIGQMLSKKGNKFIILDAGGGTVDFVAYEIVSSHLINLFRVKQIAAPTGGPYGSVLVDERFMAMLGDVIGEEANMLLHSEYPHVVLEIRRSWETIKINAKQDGSTSHMQLASLQSEVLDPLGLSLSMLISNYKASHELAPEARGSTRMTLPMELVASFFEPSIGLIIECLKKYRETTLAREATYLLLAGGYSGCSLLWDALSNFIANNESSESLRMFCVTKPDVAIVRGAAIYGTAHKYRVTHRIVRYTYGEKQMVRYNPNDREHRKRIDSVIKDHRGLQYIPIFRTHVTIGTEIAVGFAPPRIVSQPLTDTTNIIESNFLASTQEHVYFPDEDGVFEIAVFQRYFIFFHFHKFVCMHFETVHQTVHQTVHLLKFMSNTIFTCPVQ
jgi:hypothetical protein